MDILYFIKIIIKNALLLFLAPLLLAIVVFILTRGESRTYTSETMVYTGLASGYSIESQGNSKVDFFGTNIAFDNLINVIKMRSTMEEVALRLLAQNLSLVEPTPEYLSKDSWSKLQQTTPEGIKKLVVKGNEEVTYQNIINYKKSSFSNYIYYLLNKDDPHYSIKAISKIKVKRVSNSDIVRLQFEQNDPGICHHTLRLMNEIFTKNHSRIKENQTDAVVTYFELQLKVAGDSLAKAEDKLLLFNQENRIINYYEQTRYIASQKEGLAVEVQNERMDLMAAKAAIARLDKNVKGFKKLNLSTQNVLNLRDDLSKVASQMAIIEVENGMNRTISTENSKLFAKLSEKANGLRIRLAKEVDRLYAIQHSQEGIVTANILDDWLENVILYEEKRARLAVLEVRSKEFTETYNRFAPLGAILTRIEREIEVAEKKYLSLLNSLAMAKLKQQNVELSSNVKVMDPPQFPLEPLPSKRMVVVAVAYIAGFMLLFVFIIAIEYLDTTLRSSLVAENAIGKRVASVLPMVLPTEDEFYKTTALNKSLDLLAKDLKLKRLQLQAKRPVVVQLFSSRVGDGKTFVADHLRRHLSGLGHQILFVEAGVDESIVYKNTESNFSISNELLKSGTPTDLLLKIDELLHFNPEYLLVEIPSNEFRSYMVDIQYATDLSYLVVRSNREWSSSDRKFLGQYDRIMEESEIEIILNGVQMQGMEVEIGELSKPRSNLRQFFKKVIKFQFFKKQSIR